MAKNAHLTYDERLTIQSSLADHLSFKAIGLIIGKDPSTISKEIKSHIKIVETSAFNPCLYSRTCNDNDLADTIVHRINDMLNEDGSVWGK